MDPDDIWPTDGGHEDEPPTEQVGDGLSGFSEDEFFPDPPEEIPDPPPGPGSGGEETFGTAPERPTGDVTGVQYLGAAPDDLDATDLADPDLTPLDIPGIGEVALPLDEVIADPPVGADPDLTGGPDLPDGDAGDGGDVFPPELTLPGLPEPIDGFPWVDVDLLGAVGPDADLLSPLASPDPAELAAYAGQDGAGWAELRASDDPATNALARWWTD